MAAKSMTRTNVTNDSIVTVKENSVKKYNNDDLILCKSIVNGRLYVTGERSRIPYVWADYGDVVEVEYQDLIYMIRSKDKTIFLPRFLIMDEEIVKQHKELSAIYDSMYTIKDLHDILALNPNDMKKAIETLPHGAKNSIKGLVATMIDNGSFDSVGKIKIIDEIFGTKLLFTLANE